MPARKAVSPAKQRLISLAGWYGVSAILMGYALVSFSIVPSQGYVYQLLNLTGALSLATETIAKKDSQPAVLNVVWCVIALFALARLAFHLP